MAVISDWDRTTSSDWEFLAGRLSYDATNDWIENNNGYGTTAQYTVDGRVTNHDRGCKFAGGAKHDICDHWGDSDWADPQYRGPQ